MRTPYTPDEKRYIVLARIAGKTWKEIAGVLKRKEEVVQHVIRNYWFKEMTEELQNNP